MKPRPPTKLPMTFKLKVELIAAMKALQDQQYAPSMTSIVERGIELALQEYKLKFKAR